VTGLTLAVVLQTSILMNTATAPDSYSAARTDSNRSGRPMVVLVGARWCPACVEMKDNVIPKVQRRGILRRVAFALVDVDRQQKLGRQLIADGPIPQVIMYRKTREGWRRRTLVGGQSVETLTAFIEDGIRRSEPAKKAPSAPAKADTAAKPAKSL
jgi:thioredoxin-like negative regulator of GroEL